MRLAFKIFAAGTTLTCVGGGATAYRLMVSRAPPKGMVEIPAHEYNGVQDTALLEAVFRNKDTLMRSGVVLYELRSCPFCAKVKAVLDYHHIPYQSVMVDPVSLEELNGAPYRQVPQLQFRAADAVAAEVEQSGSRADKKALKAAREAFAADAVTKAHQEAKARYPQMAKGPVLVDSDAIVEKLAAPLGFAAEAKDAALAKEGEWVTNDIVRHTFGVVNNSMARSHQYLRMCTGPEWHGWFFYRWVGTAALRAIAKYKVIPRLGVEDVDQSMIAELHKFTDELEARGVPFHGGSKPDLLDLHLFGVLRSSARHPMLHHAIRRGRAEPWFERVAALAPEGGAVKTDP